MLHHTLLAAFVSAALLPAQLATIQTFGSGCAFLGQNLGIGAVGLPQLGTTFQITYAGPNVNGQISTQPVLGLGLATTNLPIPQFLLQQPPNCTQWVEPDVLLVMPLTATGTFEDQVAVPVPNNPTLIGFAFAAQWMAIVIQCGIIPPCGLDALPTSDALIATVGL